MSTDQKSVDLSQGILQGCSLESNWALVGKNSLDPLPRADEVLSLLTGERLRQVEHGEFWWSTPGPRHSLRIRTRHGQDSLGAAHLLLGQARATLEALAEQVEGRLMPTGMHPWMASEAEVWPHGTSSGEAALHWLFGAERHGWSNQQRFGLSLAFSSDAEFARLFAVLRFLMPLMPALAASSPFAEGEYGPALSCRLAARRDYFGSEIDFAVRLVPDAVTCREAYRKVILAPLEEALQRRDLHKVLTPEAVCGHGITASFEAGLIHIGMLDAQESLQADMAVAAAVAALTQLLQCETGVAEREGLWPAARLAELLEFTMIQGERAIIRDAEFLQVFGFPGGKACRSKELLQYLFEERIGTDQSVQAFHPALSKIVYEGSLATRCVRSLPEDWNSEDLYNLYRKLCECLRSDDLL